MNSIYFYLFKNLNQSDLQLYLFFYLNLTEINLCFVTKILYLRHIFHFFKLEFFKWLGFLNLLKISTKLYLFNNKL